MVDYRTIQIIFLLIKVYVAQKQPKQSDYSVKEVQVFSNVNTFYLIILIPKITGLITD